MAEERRGKHKIAKRTGRYIWLVVILTFMGIAGIFIFLHLNSPSVEECLAIINTGQAIPDSQNAAVIYNLLLEDPNTASLGYR